MRDEHFFAERVTSCGSHDIGGKAGQIAKRRAVFVLQHKRNQSRSGWLHFQSELAGKIVSKRRRSDLWNRKPTRRDHQDRRLKFFRFRANDKSIRAANVANIAIENNVHAGGTAFGFEHVHDLARGMVAEELAEIFLMEGNAVFFDQGDEIRRRVARQGRLCEVRIGRQEIFRTAVEVCEIATASAGNEDFSAGAVPSLEHSDAPPAFTRFDGAQQTGRAGADNDSVVLAGHWVMVRFCGE